MGEHLSWREVVRILRLHHYFFELNVLILEHPFLPILYLRTEEDWGQMGIQRLR